MLYRVPCANPGCRNVCWFPFSPHRPKVCDACHAPRSPSEAACGGGRRLGRQTCGGGARKLATTIHGGNEYQGSGGVRKQGEV